MSSLIGYEEDIILMIHDVRCKYFNFFQFFHNDAVFHFYFEYIKYVLLTQAKIFLEIKKNLEIQYILFIIISLPLEVQILRRWAFTILLLLHLKLLHVGHLIITIIWTLSRLTRFTSWSRGTVPTRFSTIAG